MDSPLFLNAQIPPPARTDTLGSPPAYTAMRSAPLTGIRIPLQGSTLPPPAQLGPPVATDKDGASPVYLGSTFFKGVVHPCKVAPHLTPPCRVSWGGREYKHWGRFDVLPFDPSTMEWVWTRQGKVPPGRRPVEGGYEREGKLYHGMDVVEGVRVPGKIGGHFRGSDVPYGGKEVYNGGGQQMLCWRD